MRVDLFDYDLPEDRIARFPADPRESARLLDLTGGALVDRTIADLPDRLQPGDLLIANDTRVIPARLDGRRGDAKIEVTLHKREGDAVWRAFARPAKKLRPLDRLAFADDLAATVTAKGDAGEVTLTFDQAGPALMEALVAHGRMPLPPYIKRRLDEAHDDASDYQTVFAARDGAVAAPTAGLHFTPDLLARIEARGVRRALVTLHVGAGTFLPVKVDDTSDHVMHSEWGDIPAGTAAAIAETRASGGRIVAAGTTTLRILEAAARTAAAQNGTAPAWSGETDLFITPGDRFEVVDLLLTNFHLPRSTLLMLVSAFSGRERILAAYDHAIRSGYRFFSYGDACLLAREVS